MREATNASGTPRRPVSRRHVLAGALAALGSGGLVACAGGAAAPSGGGAGQPAAPGGTVEFWYWGTPAILDGFSKGIAAFEQANQRVKVNPTSSPYNGFYEKLQATLAGGTQPDLSLMEALNLVTYQKRQWIRSWQDDTKDVDLSKYYRTLFDDLNRVPARTGQLWGLPIYQHTWMLVYNKELFDKAGVKPPDNTWTWQTWEETAARLTGNGVYGWGSGSGLYEPWAGMVQQGKNMLDDKGETVLFDSPEGVKVVEHLATLYASSGGINNADLKALNVPLVLTGQVAMDTTHTWSMTQDVYRTSKVPWDMAVYPPRATAGAQKACMGFGDSLVLYQQGKNRDGAVSLAKSFLKDPFQSEIVTSWGLMPVLQSAMPSFLKNAPPDKNFAGASEQLAYMHSFQVTDDFSTWSKEITGAILPALDKKQPPAEIAKTLGANANAKLKEILARP